MRVVAVHSDLIVFVSSVWQTTCTALRVGNEGFVIDSPVFPSELDALPGVLEQAGFPVSGLLATHGDWDHLLGPTAFADAPLGCAETTANRLTASPGEAQRALKAFDEEHYVDGRRPLGLGSFQALPVPGKLAIGPEDRELELYPADGHTGDGVAYWIPWLTALACGDYLSPVEIPMLSPGGSATAYLATLERLRPLVERSSSVIPGHGGPLSRDQALSLLAEDAEYVAGLQNRGLETALPAGRRTQAQRRIHAENASRLSPSM